MRRTQTTLSRYKVCDFISVYQFCDSVYCFFYKNCEFSLAFRIAHTIILEDPFDDPPLKFPDRSPSPTMDLFNVILFVDFY